MRKASKTGDMWSRYGRLMLGADNKKQWIRYISISCLPVRQVLNFFNIRIYVTIALNAGINLQGKYLTYYDGMDTISLACPTPSAPLPDPPVTPSRHHPLRLPRWGSDNHTEILDHLTSDLVFPPSHPRSRPGRHSWQSSLLRDPVFIGRQASSPIFPLYRV